MSSALFPVGAPDVLYLIDLSGYVFRAYHAIAPLSAPNGEPTQAVFGTVNMLERLLRERKPQLLAVAMDSRTPTFRKELYPAYKANRPPPPEDLKLQFQRVAELVETFPIPCFQADGYEADDLIASAVKQCRALGVKVVIVSADKDLMQLVGDDVLLWDTMRDRVFGVPEVEERFGVKVAQVLDVLALMGDSSDNVPGVPGVGPKTAQELIREFGSLDGIYANLEQIKKKKLKENLELYREQAELSRKLIQLAEDTDIDFHLDALRLGQRNLHGLRELYAKLGFQRQIATLDREISAQADAAKNELSPGTAAAPQEVPHTCITTLAELEQLETQAKASGQLAVVACTVGEAPMTAVLVGLGFAAQQGQGYYVPLRHRSMGAPKQLDLGSVTAFLERLTRDSVALVGHDLRSLLVLLQQNGADVPPRKSRADFDTLLAAYLLDPGGRHDLEPLVLAQLGQALPTLDDLLRVEGKRTRRELDEAQVDETLRYAAPRAVALLALAAQLQTELEEQNLHALWTDLELPLLWLLVELEQRGILIDVQLLAELAQKTGTQLAKLEKQAHQLAGKEFNVNSPRQLETLLFDDLGLKPIKRTKTSRSTDAATLEALAEEHSLPKVILEIRQLAKLKGTYLDSLPLLVNKKTGRLHTRWHQEVAATGRLSSSDPNLQNIPIRTELGSAIREAFIAAPGHCLISADYSQIELRVLAHLSQDPVLLDAFRSGQDIHLRTAMEIFELGEPEVTAEHRRRAKAVNFGVIYGQGDSALGKSLGIARTEAGEFIATYFRRYAGVQRYMNELLEAVRSSGTVRTLFDRRRLVPDINNPNRALRLGAERIAMNTPIQGTAADLLKLAMLKLREPVTPGTRMLLTVHDELVFETPKDEAPAAAQAIQSLMQEVYPLDVPLVVDVGYGPNWKAAH